MRQHAIHRSVRATWVVGTSALLCVVSSASLASQTPVATPAAVRADSALVRPTDLRGLGPNGATLRCRDGSYPAPFAPESSCDAKGGVLVKFRVRGTPAPLPAPPAAPAAPASVTAPLMERPPSKANTVIAAPVKPEGATLLCRDGTFVVADTSAIRCAQRGGVKVRFLPSRPR
jgi:hypothetical protein